MSEPRGELHKVPASESFGTRLATGLFVEVALWIAAGLVWLALDGGIVGFLIAAVVAVFVGVAWRDVARRAENPIQERTRSNE
jgi:membrane protein implicated in regulation of membrane protease activity